MCWCVPSQVTLLHPMPAYHCAWANAIPHSSKDLLPLSLTMTTPTVQNWNLEFEKMVKLSTPGYDEYAADAPHIIKCCHHQWCQQQQQQWLKSNFSMKKKVKLSMDGYHEYDTDVPHSCASHHWVPPSLLETMTTMTKPNWNFAHKKRVKIYTPEYDGYDADVAHSIKCHWSWWPRLSKTQF